MLVIVSRYNTRNIAFMGERDDFFFNSFGVPACSGIYQGKVNKVTYLGGMILAKMDENSRMMPALVPR